MIDVKRRHYAEQFGLSRKQMYKMTQDVVTMLDRCKSDVARRLILRGLENADHSG